MNQILQMRGITKHFPGVLANDHIDFDVNEGEIHALLGENGSGKTTLMNILYGLYQPQEGIIIFDGKEVKINSPLQSIELKIGMVHQHFMLIPVFTVVENVILGIEAEKGIKLDLDKAREEIRHLSHEFGLDVDPDAIVWQLPVGMQQRVETLKALYRGAKLLILDEPTAVLTPQEINDLFKILRDMRSHGTSIIFISHKLNEVMSISDRVTILNRGKVIHTVNTKDTSPSELARMMVGREVFLHVDLISQETGDIKLKVENLKVLNDKKLIAVNDLSLELRSGEILGIAGVDGNGQSELSEALGGLRPIESGKVFVNGVNVTNKRPEIITQCGMSYVPQDRKKHGVVIDFSLAENSILRSHKSKEFSANGFSRKTKINEYADDLIKKFDIRTPNSQVHAKTLSGGNMQKLICAREFSRPHEVLIVVQPTRGLDVAAMEFIYSSLVDERSRGTAILLISTELDEVFSLSDRIAVIYEGKIVGELARENFNTEQIGLLMAGSVTH